MSLYAVEGKTQSRLLDIPAAAFQAGYTIREFRRIIEEDRIPVVQIGRRCFITTSALEDWNSTHGEARLEECINQLDRWLQQDGWRSAGESPENDH